MDPMKNITHPQVSFASLLDLESDALKSSATTYGTTFTIYNLVTLEIEPQISITNTASFIVTVEDYEASRNNLDIWRITHSPYHIDTGTSLRRKANEPMRRYTVRIT